MLKQELNLNKWGNRQKAGTILAGRAVCKTSGGYTVELDFQQLKGLLVTNDFVKIGANVLVKLVGYSNGKPLLAPVWAAQAC